MIQSWYCKLVKVTLASPCNKQLIFISEFQGDANFNLASFTMLICSTINYINKIDHLTNGDWDRSNGFETIVRYLHRTEVFFESWD